MKSESFPSAKQPAAKRSGSSMKSKTDWGRLTSPGKNGHATEEHPEFDPGHVVRGIVRRGLEPVPSKEPDFTAYRSRCNRVVQGSRSGLSDSNQLGLAGLPRCVCGLTPRSSGAPTACHAGHQSLGLRPILRLLSSAPCHRRPLSSNVRPRKACCQNAMLQTNGFSSEGIGAASAGTFAVSDA